MNGKGKAPDERTAWDSISPEIDKSKPNELGESIGERGGAYGLQML